MPHTIQHQEQDAKGAFYAEKDGQRLAEMTYSRTNATMVIVDHTEGDPSLSGQGGPLCPFAKAQFDKDATTSDVLV